MVMNIKLNGKFMAVPSGAVNYMISGMLENTITIKEARKYLSKQKLPEPIRFPEFGYIDFDNLTEDGKPSIVGEFYKEHTVIGLRLTGKFEERLERLKRK